MLHVIHLYLPIAAQLLFHLLLYNFLYHFILCHRLHSSSEWKKISSYLKGEGRSNTTEKAVEEGRYIKGDPLNGYYDFVITEGSYKFWVVFQVSTKVVK